MRGDVEADVPTLKRFFRGLTTAAPPLGPPLVDGVFYRLFRLTTELEHLPLFSLKRWGATGLAPPVRLFGDKAPIAALAAEEVAARAAEGCLWRLGALG